MPPRIVQVLAISLSGLAGFVDSLGYLSLGRLFVAFMSGNSTVLGISLAREAEGRVELSGGLVLAFVVGVMVGTTAGHRWPGLRAPLVLVLVAAMLALAWAVQLTGLVATCGLLLAAAMGVENTVFAREGQSGLGLTYMTGTLVRLGQRLAEASAGRRPWAAVGPDTLLWVAMVAGAAAGAWAFAHLQLDAIWLAVAASLGMAALAWAAQHRH